MIHFRLLTLNGLKLKLELPQRGQETQLQVEDASVIPPQAGGTVPRGPKLEGLRIFPKPPVGMAEGDLQCLETGLKAQHVPEPIAFAFEPPLLGEEVKVLQAPDGGGEGAGGDGSMIRRIARMVFHGHVPGRWDLGGFRIDELAGPQEGGVKVFIAVTEMRAVVVFIRRVG